MEGGRRYAPQGDTHSERMARRNGVPGIEGSPPLAGCRPTGTRSDVACAKMGFLCGKTINRSKYSDVRRRAGAPGGGRHTLERVTVRYCLIIREKRKSE